VGVTEIAMAAVIGQLQAVLGEGLEGPPGPWSYFTDNDPGAGLNGTLGKLSAADASRAVGGSTIAAHVYHVTFALGASTAWIEGDRTPRVWQESWRARAVDDALWSELLDGLRAVYEALRTAIALHAAFSPEAMGGAIGAVAHVAYHLGAIRQKVAILDGERGAR
jgi:hypothetical protein